MFFTCGTTTRLAVIGDNSWVTKAAKIHTIAIKIVLKTVYKQKFGSQIRLICKNGQFYYVKTYIATE